MSKPKKYPPYKVVEAQGEKWIQDCNECDVILSIQFSGHYYDIYSDDIMQIICDALNKKDTEEAQIESKNLTASLWELHEITSSFVRGEGCMDQFFSWEVRNPKFKKP